MPEMDGVEATRRILANYPSDRRPRIVALTANVLPGDQAQFRAAGMDDFLSKPFAVDDLKVTLMRCPPTKGAPRPAAAPAAPPPARPAEPGLDIEVLYSLRSMRSAGTKEVFKELLSVVEGEFPGLMERLRTADASEAVRKAAHAMRGSASTIGANKLAKAVEKVEKEARAGEISKLTPEQLERFQAMVDQVLEELRIEAS
jgi:CheY-like chemotaxis protein